MALKHRVQQLVSYVEQGKILEAIEEFYADDVTMQDNLNPPTVGKPANLARERQFLASVAQVHENRAAAVIVDAPHAAIHWRFDFTGTNGRRMRFDQIAYQTWVGDRIAHERFVYDPGTLEAA